MSSTSPNQQHCQTDDVPFHTLRNHARQRASQSIACHRFRSGSSIASLFVFVWSPCAILLLCLFGWSRMSPADRCGMKGALSGLAAMDCNNIDVLVKGEEAQCRVIEKTACGCNTLENECGI